MQWLNQYATAIQALAAVAVVLATVVLAIFNRQYVKITDAALKISQEQLKRQSGVYVRFGLRCTPTRIELWVANLGAANFLLSELHIRTPDSKEVTMIPINAVVSSGKRGRRFPLSDDFYHYSPSRHKSDLDISLLCVSSGEEKQTEWLSFSVYRDDGSGRTVRPGLHALWAVKCPVCNETNLMSMRTAGLRNLGEAWDRVSQTERELGSSCPNHSSQWLNS